MNQCKMLHFSFHNGNENAACGLYKGIIGYVLPCPVMGNLYFGLNIKDLLQ